MNYIHQTDCATDASWAGNKALRLAELATAGFCVPKFFVIDPAACGSSLAAQDEPVTSDASLTCRAQVREQITLAISELFTGDERLAVRSSAADEDGKRHSFAGQLDTFLNIDQANVCHYVSAVWKSASSER